MHEDTRYLLGLIAAVVLVAAFLLYTNPSQHVCHGESCSESGLMG